MTIDNQQSPTMTMTSSAGNVNAAVKERVLSWLHDDEALVTSQRIQQECRQFDDENDASEGQALSRYEGSQVLTALFDAGEEKEEEDSHGNITNNKYIATLCTVHEYTTPVILDDNMWGDGQGGEGGMEHTDEYKTTGTFIYIYIDSFCIRNTITMSMSMSMSMSIHTFCIETLDA